LDLYLQMGLQVLMQRHLAILGSQILYDSCKLRGLQLRGAQQARSKTCKGEKLVDI
jgi:hypothetical protein